MPSRGSRTIKNPSKPKVERANGITAEADTLKRANRNPVNRAVPELDANANAFVHVSGLIDELRAQGNDKVPVSIHYEMDVFW